MHIGHALQSMRREAGISQADLGARVAELLGRDVPFEQATVSRWESNTTPMTLDVMMAIETIIGCPAGEMLRKSGYLTPAASLPEVIAESAEVSAEGRRALQEMYLALRRAQQ